MAGRPLNRWFTFNNGCMTMIGVVIIFISGCHKDGGVCISSPGPVVLESRIIENFDSIAMYDYLNLILTQDTINRVLVETGSNIARGISTEVSNRQLILHNRNKCNWLRDYDIPINVYVSVKNLMKLHYESSGNVTTTNKLTSWDLKVDLWGGCGSVTLEVDNYSGTFIQYLGTADLTLHGICKICSLFAGEFGPFHCEDLQTGYLYIISNSSNDCYILAGYYLDATIRSIGNIYYYGKPDTMKITIEGSGNVIQL
jgi:hypothetical protein